MSISSAPVTLTDTERRARKIVTLTGLKEAGTCFGCSGLQPSELSSAAVQAGIGPAGSIARI